VLCVYLVPYTPMAYVDLDQGEKFLYDAHFKLSGELEQALYTLIFLAPNRLTALLSMEYPHEVHAVFKQKQSPDSFDKIIKKVEDGASDQEIPHKNINPPNFRGGANPNKL